MGPLLTPPWGQILPQSFDGSTSIITIPAYEPCVLTTQTILVGSHPKGTTGTNAEIMFCHCDSAATNGFVFRIVYSAGASTFRLTADSTGTAQKPERISSTTYADAYTDYCATWDGSLTAANIHLYAGVTGAPMVEASYASTVNGTGSVKGPTGQAQTIGNRPGAARPWNGDIYYIARWNRVLSLTEIELARRDSPLAVQEGLVFFWANGEDQGPFGLTASAQTAVPFNGTSSPYVPGAQETPTWLISSDSGTDNQMTAVLGTLTLTGLVPSFTQGNTLTAPLGTLTLTGLLPTFSQPVALTAPLGTLTLTGLLPTFSQPVALIAPLGTLTLTGLVPSFTQGNTLTGPLGTLTLTGLVPTFTQSGGNILDAPLGTLTLQGLVPSLTQGNLLSAPLGTLTLQGLDPTFSQSGGPAPPSSSGAFAMGGGKRSDENLDELETFRKLERRMAKGESLATALRALDTPEVAPPEPPRKLSRKSLTRPHDPQALAWIHSRIEVLEVQLLDVQREQQELEDIQFLLSQGLL